MTRAIVAPFESATLEVRGPDTVAHVQFFDDSALHAEHPCALRIERTALGNERALEIETPNGELIRLALRALIVPDELDGLVQAGSGSVSGQA